MSEGSVFELVIFKFRLNASQCRKRKRCDACFVKQKTGFSR